MILDNVNFPHDLKKLTLKELDILAGEIRELIIEVVSRNGGHLASSLGAVELCIALHYCLDGCHDHIVFDVGHQCYAHKILTGRKEGFNNLRTYKGVSGFPNPQESAYDAFISGHAATAVSWVQGLAEAKKIKGDNSKTVAVIGDGSLTGGMCFEALNNCGHLQSNVLVIFNHNEMSISQSVGALSRYLNKIISAPVYNRIKTELEDFLQHFSLGKKLTLRAKRFEEALKGLIIPGIFFEELGFRYFGPIDGHNLPLFVSTLKNIVSLKGPRILHVVTKKGKGYKFSEDNPESFHSAAPFNREKGIVSESKSISFSEAFAGKLTAIARKDERIVAVTAAMLKGTGLNLFADKFPHRLFDVGIAEEHAVGFAAGLARQGLKPVVAIYSTFLQRSFDQIIHDVALQDLGVIFALDRAGVVGEDGPTHHGLFDVGYLRLIPNMVCMAAKDKEELEDMLEFAVKLTHPVSIRFPKGEAYSLGSREKIKLGKAQILCEGRDVCIIAIGSMVKTAKECMFLLEKDNINAMLVNMRFIKPVDEDLLSLLADRFKTIVTLEENNLDCGFGSAVLEFYEKEGLLNKVKLARFGFPDKFITFAGRDELLRMHGLDSYSLTNKIKKILVKEEVSWPK